jgi:myo-inositol 2-dehydrogenase/D-chiro-inositol 1-dehydrogenase
VVAACDIDPAKLDRLARFYNVPGLHTDIGDMLAKERLDAVVIAAGHQQNFPLMKAALEAGVHVFVEKTPCNDTAEAKALAELQRKSGKALMVGFNRRFMTGYAMAGRSHSGRNSAASACITRSFTPRPTAATNSSRSTTSSIISTWPGF